MPIKLDGDSSKTLSLDEVMGKLKKIKKNAKMLQETSSHIDFMFKFPCPSCKKTNWKWDGPTLMWTCCFCFYKITEEAIFHAKKQAEEFSPTVVTEPAGWGMKPKEPSSFMKAVMAQDNMIYATNPNLVQVADTGWSAMPWWAGSDQIHPNTKAQQITKEDYKKLAKSVFGDGVESFPMPNSRLGDDQITVGVALLRDLILDGHGSFDPETFDLKVKSLLDKLFDLVNESDSAIPTAAELAMFLEGLEHWEEEALQAAEAPLMDPIASNSYVEGGDENGLFWFAGPDKGVKATYWTWACYKTNTLMHGEYEDEVDAFLIGPYFHSIGQFKRWEEEYRLAKHVLTPNDLDTPTVIWTTSKCYQEFVTYMNHNPTSGNGGWSSMQWFMGSSKSATIMVTSSEPTPLEQGFHPDNPDELPSEYKIGPFDIVPVATKPSTSAYQQTLDPSIPPYETMSPWDAAIKVSGVHPISKGVPGATESED